MEVRVRESEVLRENIEMELRVREKKGGKVMLRENM